MNTLPRLKAEAFYIIYSLKFLADPDCSVCQYVSGQLTILLPENTFNKIHSYPSSTVRWLWVINLRGQMFIYLISLLFTDWMIHLTETELQRRGRRRFKRINKSSMQKVKPILV